MKFGELRGRSSVRGVADEVFGEDELGRGLLAMGGELSCIAGVLAEKGRPRGQNALAMWARTIKQSNNMKLRPNQRKASPRQV